MRRILFFIMTLVISIPMFAQEDFFGDGNDVVSKPSKHALFIGPKAGFGMSTVSDPSEGKLGDGMGMGFSVGAAMNLRFGQATENSSAGTGLWGVGLEVKYRQNVAKTVGYGMDSKMNENEDLKISMVEVPVFVHVYPFAKYGAANTLYFEAGVSLAKILKCSPEVLAINGSSLDQAQVIYYLDKESSKINGGDIHPFAGLGYTIPHTGLDLNVRYHFGMTDLAKNFKCSMSTLEISVSYMFSVCKF